MSLSDISLNNKSLISDLLTMMQTQKLDYTETFLQLTQSLTDDAKAQELESKLGDFYFFDGRDEFLKEALSHFLKAQDFNPYS